jgi:hypothetical protein
MIKAKLYMNVHWTVLYNLKVFCSDMKFKMVATAGLSLTLDPMGSQSEHIIGPGSHIEYPTGTFLLSLVPIGPVVSEKKLEM